MARYGTKKVVKRVVSIVLAVAALAGSVFGVVKLSNYLKDDTKKITPTFVVGSIDEESGKPDKEDSKSLYTKDSFKAKGLEVILDFDHNVTYQVFWYDQLGEFAYATEELSKGEKFYAPYAHTARIEVTPQFDVSEDDEDEAKVKWYNVSKYSSQLEIRVDKEQSLKKSDYTKLDLADSMWSVKEGQYFNPVVGEYVTVEDGSSDVRCYEWTNDGTRSAMYVDSFKVREETSAIYGLHVRLVNGESIFYYSSSDTTTDMYDDNDPLPTFETPMIFPKGATVYLWAHFGEATPAETVLCFY